MIVTNEQELAQACRSARVKQGLTQCDVAIKAGVSQAHVSAVELGRVSPSTSYLLKLVAVTGAQLTVTGGAKRVAI